ncbi:MAG: hypothetical protein R3F65_01560 [bacterium]
MRGGLASLALLMASPAAANPLDAFGFGARAVGMGGAATAVSTDVAANYYNPAGLAAGDGLRLDLGYAFVRPELRIAGGDQRVDDSRGFQGGVALPGVLFGRRVGFSLGLHLPDERVSRIRALPQRQPRWVLWDNRPQRVVITSSVALEVIEGLFVGGGLTYLANTAGTLDITGDVGLFDVELTRLSSAVDVDLASVRYASAGVLYQGDGWRLGAAWRQDFSLKLDLDVRVTGRVLSAPELAVVPEGLFLLRSLNDNLYSPQQVFVGAAVTLGDWLVAVDVGWLDWSRFPSPTARLELALELAPLSFELPLPAEPLAPGFHDIVVPRVGAEWAALAGEWGRLLVRGGGFYEPSPAPDQRGRRTTWTGTSWRGRWGWGCGWWIRAGCFRSRSRWTWRGRWCG